MQLRRRLPFEELFVPEPNSGCWLWIGSMTRRGDYGRIWRCGGHILAHRFSFELHNGPLQDGMNVLHRCDNPCCVNPEHLFIGTQTDNLKDMWAKGRGKFPGLKGSAIHNSKLTDEIVATIRSDPRRQVLLADIYGVSQGTISNIKLRNTWKHVK